MEKQPKVLVLTIESWNSRVGANTYSSLFSHFSPENVYNIFLREDIPDNPACLHYFQISEMQVIKSVFSRKTKTGREITEEERQNQANSENLEKSRAIYRKKAKGTQLLVLIAREIIWRLSGWKSKELDGFLEKSKPDVVVVEMSGYLHYNRLCRYVVRKTGAKAIGYFLDDCFTYRRTKFSFFSLRPFVRKSLKKLAGVCDAFWAITEKTKREADEFFGIDCRVLTKPIPFAPDETWIPYEPHSPIRMLYAGKLGIGRSDVLLQIAGILREINCDGEKITLDVYTTSDLSDKEKQAMLPFVHLQEPVRQDELAKIQAEADVLLFAEAYEGRNAKIARLSFSTKLTEYLHSGKCIFAVGHPEIAPMEYLKTEGAAVCTGNLQEIRDGLIRLTEHPEEIPAMGQAAYDCGKRNHSAAKIEKTVDETIQKILSDKG